MAGTYWGELEDKSDFENSTCAVTSAKKTKLDELLNAQEAVDAKRNTLKIKNPLVTQTIEVMKQTEMLQSLIDTYSNKSGSSNYLLNPCQMIPEVDFPSENATDLISEDKFQKPIWFIPTLDTPFTRGDLQPMPEITNAICRAAFRKAVCGQLRVAGFTDTTESALILFADAIEQFLQSLVQKMHGTDRAEGIEERDLQVAHVEKAYFELTDTPVTQVHNFYKHNLISRNRSEIFEFNTVRHEYDKLMKESQNMQKSSFPENDLLKILEMPNETNENPITVTDMLQELGQASGSTNTNTPNMCSNAAIMTMLDNAANPSMQVPNSSYMASF